MNKEIEKKLPKGQNLSDDDIVSVIKSEVKKRKDSYLSYSQAKRSDLADKEEKEIVILEKYLPEQMSDDQIKDMVLKVIKDMGATSSADFGKVMGATMKELGDSADIIVHTYLKDEPVLDDKGKQTGKKVKVPYCQIELAEVLELSGMELREPTYDMINQMLEMMRGG